MRPANVVEYPNLQPGTCVKCLCNKTPNRKYFVDIGVDLEYGGVIYICNMCLLDINRQTPDFYSQKQMDDVASAMAETNESAVKALVQKKELDKALQALGIDADVLLKNAAKVAEDLERLPEIRKQLAEAILEVQMQKSESDEAKKKIEALSEYAGSKPLVRSLEEKVLALTLEREAWLREKDLITETATRLAEEANNPPVKDLVPSISVGSLTLELDNS